MTVIENCRPELTRESLEAWRVSVERERKLALQRLFDDRTVFIESLASEKSEHQNVSEIRANGPGLRS